MRKNKKKNKKNKKNEAMGRATQTVYGFMDKIFQKNRDTKPMNEEYFEKYKKWCEVGQLLKSTLNGVSTGHERQAVKYGSNANAPNGQRLTTMRLARIASALMKQGYEKHSELLKKENA
jgi:hypothetical protein|tara:strand:- start:97 stop:453 length:357 start_codon:yes stop_codon:yes gene_type:complete